MKKTLLITVVCILAIISLQLAVFADMGAPEIEPYKASISNVNGAKYYNSEGNEAGKLDYGTTITISYEIENWETKERTATFSFAEEQYEFYTISINDITPLEDEADKVKYSKEDKEELIILSEDGVEISEGPAYGYEKTGVVIPKGEELTGYRTEKMGSAVPWFFVTYEGTSGWVCELNGVIGYGKDYEDQKLLTPRATKIYKEADYRKAAAVIPANTIITDFLEIDDWSQGYYVTYEGVSGYLSNGYCAVNFPWLETEKKSFEYEVNYPEVKLYKEANTNGEVLIDNIPVGTKLEYFYGEDIRFTGWIYTSYNNVNGWVYYIEDGSVYKDYLQYANDAILAQESEEIEEDVIEENEEVTENTVTERENEETVMNEVATEEQKENKGSSTMVSATQIVIICAMFGVTIAVTSFVTIALVNRKKK